MQKAGIKSGFLCLLATLSLPIGFSQAQQLGKIPVVGYVAGTRRTEISRDANLQAFRQRLKELGYVEGKNIRIEYRYVEGKGPAAEAEHARELVGRNVDLLVVSAYPSIRAAKEATKKIPIVMVSGNDPVAYGLIDSLSHPGANITGVSHLARELSGKRLELLLEIVPNLSRIGFLLPKGLFDQDVLKRYEAVARALKIEHRAIEIRTDSPDLPTAFDAAMKARVNAMIPIRNGTINVLTPQIAELAIKNHLPTMFERIGAVEHGGLASYSADELEGFRRAAVYVDKILKGAKPADLPVEQSTKFPFEINLKTANQIDLTIPQRVLARADRVIK
jgi:ABC-type uncharacterized transport system substrate-binding protein